VSRSNALGREAVVVGSGMGGLVAARVLSDFFERVTVLERDPLDQGGAARAGVPQGKHLHALLAGGQRVLEELLPGFRDDLDRVGAVRIRTGLDLLMERPGFDPFPQRDLGFWSASLTRPQLEYCVRRRIESVDGVHVEPGCRVLALLATDDGSAIRAVHVQRSGRSETRTADLVVDASGTGELTLEALRAGGHPVPAETIIGVDLGYSTTIFDIPADAPTGWRGVMHLPAAPQTSRAALLTTIEGNRWMLALGGRFGEHPPGDEAGVREYASTLRTRTIADAIAGARMTVDVERYRFRESRLRHFERLDGFPRGLLPIGDAICRFNPIFGQGMSVAALQAHALGQVLGACAQDGSSFADAWRPYFRRVAETVEAPWALAALPDLAFPSTVGERPPDFVASLRFSVALARAGAIHPDIHKLSGEIQHLLRPRSALMEPHVLERILREMPT
jgi:2-polyprenyl-6-methoxyphenol hydroxylase-like FAD-dependent oxidoreductase